MLDLTRSFNTVKGRVRHSPTFRNRIYHVTRTFQFKGVKASVSYYCQRLIHKAMMREDERYEPDLSDKCFAAESFDASLDELAIESPNAKWGLPYEPTRRDLFDKALRSLPIRLADYNFIDLGAGKGWALVLASEYSFKSITGVEYSKVLADSASVYIRAHQKQSGLHACIQCIWGDATDFNLPNEPTIIYLYNPFQGDVMDRVIANIEMSLRDHPRDLWVIYANPWEGRKFRRSPMFETIEWNSEYSVHRYIPIVASGLKARRPKSLVPELKESKSETGPYGM
jgi:hypothetical protein